MKIESLVGIDKKFLDECDGLIMLSRVEEKMGQLLQEIDLLHKEAKRYFWAGTIGLAVQLTLTFTSGANLWWVLSFVFTMAMLYFQYKTLRMARERMRFIDGMLFVSIETTKDFAEFRKDVEGKIPPEVTEAIKNLRKSEVE